MDEASKDLCAIVTPFGNYRYTRLPMGVKQSPDIAQAHLEQLLSDIPECDVYIDDVGIFSNDWQEHMKCLRKILQKLQDHGFTCNPLKCEFCVQETDWLGYWLTPNGLKPSKKRSNRSYDSNHQQISNKTKTACVGSGNASSTANVLKNRVGTND